MSNTSILRLVLASVNVTTDTAKSSPSSSHGSVTSLPRVSGGQIAKPRKPNPNDKYASSSFRPHVPASD